MSLNTVWEVWTYDVWGNSEEGYWVNDRSCIDRNMELAIPVSTHNVGTPRQFSSAYPTDKQIREALDIKEDVKIETGGDGLYITVDSEDGYPLGEMTCISHKSLSPIQKLAVGDA